MELQSIRRNDEYVLRIFGFIFSALFWIGLCAWAVFFLVKPLKVSQPCVWFDVENDEFSYSLRSLAIKNNFEKDCLAQKDVPSSEFEAAAKAELAAAKKDKYASFMATSIFFYYIVLFFLFVYISTGVSMAVIRLNGVRLSPAQFAKFYALYVQTAQALELKNIPAAYIIDGGGVANAFAIKIARKNMIVFYSEVIQRLLADEKYDELKAIAAHELTHAKLGHIHYKFFLMPFFCIPILRAYFSRLQELSADRGALFVCPDDGVVSRALLKLVVGTVATHEMNVDEYVSQVKQERGLFAFIARLAMSHPAAPVRVAMLQAVQKNIHIRYFPWS